MARARLADWAQAAYAAPGVADLCLALQDEHGQSVCLLLWAAWAGATDRPVDQLGAASLARTWEANVVGPLRAARRGLKAAPGLTDADRAALRARVRADELAAEWALLAALEALAPGSGQATDPLEAMIAASTAWGVTAPVQRLSKLAAAFPRG